jgi:hypothetical protein
MITSAPCCRQNATVNPARPLRTILIQWLWRSTLSIRQVATITEFQRRLKGDAAQAALSEAEDAFGVAVQEQVGGLVVEVEAGEVLEAVLGRPGRVVGAEQDLAPPVARR